MSFADLFDTSLDGNKKPAGKAGKKAAAVHVCMVQQVEYGQHLRLIGSAGELGQWDAGYGPDMKWHEGNRWTAHVALAPGTHEFKFARVHRSGEVEWEPGKNRQLEVPPSAAELQVAGSWGQTQETEVLELREKTPFEQQRRQQQKKMLEDDNAASHAAAAAAIKQREVSAAAAAADTLAQMLQHASRADRAGAAAAPADSLDYASDAAAAARAAAAASDEEVQHLAEAVAAAATDIELLEALSEAVARAAGASNAVPSAKKVAGKARPEPSAQHAAAAAMLPAVEQPAAAVVAGNSDHQELVRMLADLRSDMASSMGEVSTTMHDVQGELSAVQQQMEALKAERAALALAAGAKDSEEEASGIREIDATLSNMKTKAATAAITAGARAGSAGASAAAAAGDPAALSGLHSAVLSWRHELLSFRQDSSELRQEIDVVKGALTVVENQLELTASSVSSALQGVEQQLQANTSAVSGVKDTVKSVGDSVSGLLLLRLDQLRDELRAEVHELVGVLQASGSARPNGNGRALVPAVVCDEDAAASVVGLLQSTSTALWFKGFLYCIMMATGLWSEGLQDEIKGEAMRLTWQAYTCVWPEEQLNSWRHQLSKQDQVVQAAASGGVNNSTKPLALHALWSITELSRHSMQVRMLLQAICTPEEADLVMQLRPGGDSAACAKVLRRWMTAANAAASAAASVTVPPPVVGASTSW